MRIIIYLISIMSVLSNVLAQSNEMHSKNKVQTYITVNSDAKDSLVFTYRDNYWGWSSTFPPKKIIFKRGERIIVPIQDSSIFLYADLAFTNGKKIFSRYIIEAGDSITVDIHKKYTFYSGNGKEKYECRQEIEKALQNFENSNIDSLNKLAYIYGSDYATLKEDSIGSYERILNINLAFYADKRVAILSTLNQYHKKLSEHFYQQLLADYLGYLNEDEQRSYSLLNLIAESKNSKFADSCKRVLNNICSSRIIDNFTNFDKNVLTLSDGYMASQFNLIQGQKLNPIEVIGKITASYSGVFRDRLLTVYIHRKKATKYKNVNIISEALKVVNTQYCRQALNTIQNSLSLGSRAYNFVLPDTLGNIVTLADFKGSVVILDFFFTGCSECRKLNHEMKNIYAMYKDNPHLKFVSISIDKDIEKWKNSIRNHTYTHEGSINLHTNKDDSENGKGIIKHYNISSYPTVIIINKNGMIETSDPPRPRDRENEYKLIEIIETALKN